MNDYAVLISEAYREALHSPDTSSRIGAVLADDDNRILTWGHNAPTTGIAHDDSRLFTRPSKYMFIEHAERNAIYAAAAAGVQVRGLTLVTPWSPCADCARAAVMSGVKKLVCHAEAPPLPGWDENRDAGLEILRAGKVETVTVSCVPDVEGILAGGKWYSRSCELNWKPILQPLDNTGGLSL